MALFNICKLHQPICKGRCCESTSVIAPHKVTAMFPALIKREMPFLTLTQHTSRMRVDGKRYSGFGFECGNFDKETRLCKDFANRPDMCRTFICKEAVDILALVEEPIEDLPW